MGFIDVEDKLARRFLGEIYQLFYDAKEINSSNNVITIFLGIIDDEETNLKYKILLNLKKTGVIKSIKTTKEVESKVDFYNWSDDGSDLSVASSEYVATAVCEVDELKMEGVFKDYSFYPRYFLRKYKTREIVINNKYFVSKPDFLSPNDIFFSLLYEKPNIVIPFPYIRSEIEKAVGEVTPKKLSNFLQQLNFIGEIKKLFFSQSSTNAVCLTPVVMNKDFDDYNIDEDALLSQLQGLETI